MDMDRLGSLNPGSLTGESHRLYNDIVTYFNVPYTYKLNNGQLVGPFGIELHTPGVGYAWLNMTKSLALIPSLPPLAREIAILVTGSHEQAAYEIYAHSALANLPQSDLDDVLRGRCPESLDAACKIAFQVATELCTVPGPLKMEVWEKAVSVLGREGAVAVVHYVGFYKYVATILNGFDAKVPTA